MTPPPLVDQTGRPVPLDRQLAAGGEGVVFTLADDPGRVAKVYTKPMPQAAEKLPAMMALANPQLLSLAAWPTGLLYQARGRQLAGFLMPRLSDGQPIQQLYNPVQRLKSFPRAGWKFQLRAAANLAAAFDEVHKAGCLVGDVNQSNAFVSGQALVRLLDCDSFQVRANGKQFLCEVGVVHYTPPELQGKSFRGVVRTENHDRFGLAVLIYQLLFAGRHPYMGLHQDEASFEQLIADFRFSQGPAARSWGMEPPPHTPTFEDIPLELGGLFRRAFERGSEKGARPTPAEWLTSLRRLEQETVECTADPGHTYWRGAKACVWCRLARNGGPEYYFGVAGANTFAVDEPKLQEILRRLAAAQPVEPRGDRSRFAPAGPPRPKPLPDDLTDHQSTGLVLGVALGVCLLAVPFGLVRGFICVIGLLGALVFGGWLAVLVARSPLHRERRQRRAAYGRARDDLEELEDEWDRIVRRHRRDHADLSDAVRSLVGVCRGLASQYQVDLQRHTADAEVKARLRHLRLHLIADADIPKIGAGRKQTLAANHIYTAADIDEAAIRNIKGFGDALTANLIAWRTEVLRRFRFDPAAAVSPDDNRALVARLRARQQQVIADAHRQLAELESLAPACRAELEAIVPEMRAAVAAYEQAAADLRLLNGKR